MYEYNSSLYYIHIQSNSTDILKNLENIGLSNDKMR